jgi:hypothetical protein
MTMTMKKTMWLMMAAFMALLFIPLVATMMSPHPAEAATPAAKTITVKNAMTGNVTLKKGSTYKLRVSVNPAKAHLTYKSSKKKIASVDNKGVITAKKSGKTTITVSAKKKGFVKKTISVKVVSASKYVKASKLKVKVPNKIFTPTNTGKLKVTVYPKKASNKNVRFKSLKPKVLTVKADGTLKVKKAGTAKVTVTSCADKKVTKTVKIKVWGNNVTASGLHFKIKNGKYGSGAYVDNTVATTGKVVIPNTINGKPVVSVSLPNEKLASLNCSKASDLKYLDCGNNKLTSLDVTNNSKLEFLSCYGNQLTKLNVSNCGSLTTLDCSGNDLVRINVTENQSLEDLNCGNNEITQLDLSENTGLEDLNCSKNDLGELNVSNNSGLITLNCSHNNLTSLNVSSNDELNTLRCTNNKIRTLTVKGAKKLSALYCKSNKIKTINAAGTSLTLQHISCDSSVTVTDIGA